MRRGGPWLLLLLAVAGCARPVRVERREQPIDTGLEVPFSAEAERRWDFGDGSPPTSGASVRHAFHRAGTFVVRGYEGERLRDELTVVVMPRGVFRLVPPDVQWAVAARGLEELAPAVDFAERLGGAEPVSGWFDGHPLVAWALESTAGASRVVDPREGLAVFAWPDEADTSVTAIGVVEPAEALEVAARWLLEHGWSDAGGAPGFRRFERETTSLDVFVDRGALFGVRSPLVARRPGAQARVAAAEARGLEADGPIAEALDALPSGGLAVFVRGPGAESWRFATGAIRVRAGEARLEGRLHGQGPLWAVPPSEGEHLLARAPQGPVVVAAASLKASQLAGLLLGAPGTPRRKALDESLRTPGEQVDRGLAGFAGLFEAALYFDVGAFVRSTLAAGGRPTPEGTLLFEAAVSDPAPLEGLVEAWAAGAGVSLARVRDQALRVWRGAVGGRQAELALTRTALYGRLGASPSEREAEDLLASLSRRYEGAFTAGHVSLLVDVGQLRRELLQPRRYEDVDPRRALTAQALAVTFLDRLTTLDVALVDAAPSPTGASVQVVLQLRPAE